MLEGSDHTVQIQEARTNGNTALALVSQLWETAQGFFKGLMEDETNQDSSDPETIL